LGPQQPADQQQGQMEGELQPSGAVAALVEYGQPIGGQGG
jgi:hypothetical protein